ncbi:unnamed protein product [Cladocopium goreaui]|uniref:Uncharacterized protein n=1 Tax=Cladocopium goreaui TaxID=2562237 RepID=A0A9P1FML7_9DINO|nr:unnamed protein product [Cladocopium goreaui]
MAEWMSLRWIGGGFQVPRPSIEGDLEDGCRYVIDYAAAWHKQAASQREEIRRACKRRLRAAPVRQWMRKPGGWSLTCITREGIGVNVTLLLPQSLAVCSNPLAEFFRLP